MEPGGSGNHTGSNHLAADHRQPRPENREVTVTLNAGLNTITLGNPDAYAPCFGKITVAPTSIP
jgi:hypothetical protein